MRDNKVYLTHNELEVGRSVVVEYGYVNNQGEPVREEVRGKVMGKSHGILLVVGYNLLSKDKIQSYKFNEFIKYRVRRSKLNKQENELIDKKIGYLKSIQNELLIKQLLVEEFQRIAPHMESKGYSKGLIEKGVLETYTQLSSNKVIKIEVNVADNGNTITVSFKDHSNNLTKGDLLEYKVKENSNTKKYEYIPKDSIGFGLDKYDRGVYEDANKVFKGRLKDVREYLPQIKKMGLDLNIEHYIDFEPNYSEKVDDFIINNIFLVRDRDKFIQNVTNFVKLVYKITE